MAAFIHDRYHHNSGRPVEEDALLMRAGAMGRMHQLPQPRPGHHRVPAMVSMHYRSSLLDLLASQDRGFSEYVAAEVSKSFAAELQPLAGQIGEALQRVDLDNADSIKPLLEQYNALLGSESGKVCRQFNEILGDTAIADAIHEYFHTFHEAVNAQIGTLTSPENQGRRGARQMAQRTVAAAFEDIAPSQQTIDGIQDGAKALALKAAIAAALPESGESAQRELIYNMALRAASNSHARFLVYLDELDRLAIPETTHPAVDEDEDVAEVDFFNPMSDEMDSVESGSMLSDDAVDEDFDEGSTPAAAASVVVEPHPGVQRLSQEFVVDFDKLIPTASTAQIQTKFQNELRYARFDPDKEGDRKAFLILIKPAVTALKANRPASGPIPETEIQVAVTSVTKALQENIQAKVQKSAEHTVTDLRKIVRQQLGMELDLPLLRREMGDDLSHLKREKDGSVKLRLYRPNRDVGKRAYTKFKTYRYTAATRTLNSRPSRLDSQSTRMSTALHQALLMYTTVLASGDEDVYIRSNDRTSLIRGVAAARAVADFLQLGDAAPKIHARGLVLHTSGHSHNRNVEKEIKACYEQMLYAEPGSGHDVGLLNGIVFAAEERHNPEIDHHAAELTVGEVAKTAAKAAGSAVLLAPLALVGAFAFKT